MRTATDLKTKYFDHKVDNLCEFHVLEDYVGLVNQVNTCYLNSLIHTLFMTLEFRHRILSLKLNIKQSEPKDKNLLLQLQKLFVQLITAKQSVKTLDLTKTFDWSYKSLHSQQDIQEFCRIFLEAIETCSGLTFVRDLFEGELCSSIKCLECNQESNVKCFFMDIQLPISIEESGLKLINVQLILSKFLGIDMLKDENRYACKNCKKLVEYSTKQYIFYKLPKILVIQLNRLSYDRKLQKKVKLSNPIEVNDYINLISKENEEYCYKLYSVISHIGTAESGHYITYLFSFEKCKWFLFNDEVITEISFDKVVEDTKTNAYLLFYQQVSVNSTEITSSSTSDASDDGTLTIKYRDSAEAFPGNEDENNVELRFKVDSKLSSFQLYSVLTEFININFWINGKKMTLTVSKYETISSLKLSIFRVLKLGSTSVSRFFKYSERAQTEFQPLFIASKMDQIESYINYFFSWNLFILKEISYCEDEYGTNGMLESQSNLRFFISFGPDKNSIVNYELISFTSEEVISKDRFIQACLKFKPNCIGNIDYSEFHIIRAYYFNSNSIWMIKEVEKTCELLELSYIIISRNISRINRQINPCMSLREEAQNVNEKFVSLVDQKSVKSPVKVRFSDYNDLISKLAIKFKNCFSRESCTLYYLSFSELSNYEINVVKDEYDFQRMMATSYERIYIEKSCNNQQFQSLLLTKHDHIVSMNFIYNNSRLSYPYSIIAEKQSAIVDEVICSFGLTNSELIFFFNLDKKTFTFQELAQFVLTDEASLKSHTFYIR